MTAARWLTFGASPVFLLMALLQMLRAEGVAGSLCSGSSVMPIDGIPIDGMAVMYGLMSLFHAAPWFRLLASGQASEAQAR